MLKTLRLSLAWCVLSVAATWVVVEVNGQTSKDKSEKKVPDAKLDLELSKFMRRKLDASAEILEGLTTEDSDLIVKGSKTLAEMSAAEKWQVQNDVIFRQFSSEFQRSAKGLVDAAEKKNFDAASLKWIDTTMKCLECHKFVRGARIVDSGK